MSAVSMSQPHRPLYGVLEDKMSVYVGNWAIGSTGAVGTKVGARGLTLTRTGVGLYKVQLTGSAGLAARVYALLSVRPSVIMNDDHAYLVKVKTAVAATGVITLRCYTDVEVVGGTPVAAELPSGAVLIVEVIAKLSSATR